MRRATVVSHGISDGSVRSSLLASRHARTVVSWTASSACSRLPAVSRSTNVINGSRYFRYSAATTSSSPRRLTVGI
jgi:hypothetical protein